MTDDSFKSITIAADQYNAVLYLAKISRLAEQWGLVGNLHIEPGDSVKVKLDIDRENTIKQAERRTRTRVHFEFHFQGYIDRLIQEIMKYLRDRQNKIRKRKIERRKIREHLEILEPG